MITFCSCSNPFYFWLLTHGLNTQPGMKVWDTVKWVAKLCAWADQRQFYFVATYKGIACDFSHQFAKNKTFQSTTWKCSVKVSVPSGSVAGVYLDPPAHSAKALPRAEIHGWDIWVSIKGTFANATSTRGKKSHTWRRTSTLLQRAGGAALGSLSWPVLLHKLLPGRCCSKFHSLALFKVQRLDRSMGAISGCFVMWGLVRQWGLEAACATSSLVPTSPTLGSHRAALVRRPSATARQEGQHKANTSAPKGSSLPKTSSHRRKLMKEKETKLSGPVISSNTCVNKNLRFSCCYFCAKYPFQITMI